MGEERAAAPRAVVFDLDDTLFDAFRQCVAPAQREAAAAMRAAGLRAPLEAIVALREAWAGGALDVDEAVADAFACADRARVVAAGRAAFLERDPGSVCVHPFVPEVLADVRARARSVLLTAGAAPTQRTKVARLGLERAFHEVIVVEPHRGGSKAAALAAWLEGSGLAPAEVLVVGDRPDAEIAAALALGCRALRIRAGEWSRRPTPPGVPEAEDVRAVRSFFPAGPGA